VRVIRQTLQPSLAINALFDCLFEFQRAMESLHVHRPSADAIAAIVRRHRAAEFR
jgi:hypothetical protein